MEPKLIFWIIGLILYFWIKSRKGSSPAGGPTESSEQSPIPPPGKTITFEDLLREIEATKAPKRPEPQPQPETFDEFDENFEEAEVNETIPKTEAASQELQKEDVYQTYEKAKSEAFARESLEETLKLENTNVTYTKFKEYQVTENETIAKSIASDFQNSDRLKRAFIMGEILNRKWN